MAHRRRFCVVCGLEETPMVRLSDGFCPKCLASEKPESNMRDVPSIRLCRLCGSLEERGRWIPPVGDALEENLIILLKNASTKFGWLREGEVAEISVKSMSKQMGSSSLFIPVFVKVRSSGRQPPTFTREFDSKVYVVPTICPNCGLKRQQYYEATLQIRTLGRKMSQGEKERLADRIHSLVEKNSRKNKQAFISKYEDKSEGFDVYLGSRQVAYSVASKFRLAKETVTKETFKAGKVDKSTGKRSNKVTILIRLPDQVIDDFVLGKL